MIAAILKDIYLEKTKTPLKNMVETGTRGVYCCDKSKDQQSAYELFFEVYPSEKKEGLNQPIKKEVIDFIVDSMKVTEGKIPAHFKERLKQGFYLINKKSITARALIKGIRKDQSVDLTADLSDALACVYDYLDVIFFDKELTHREPALRLATSFLHEAGHVEDDIQLRPFFDALKGYLNKKGVEIKNENQKLSAEDEFVVYRLLEAEKQAQTFQILAESMSFMRFGMKLCASLGKTYFDFCSHFIHLLFFRKNGRFILKPASEGIVVAAYKMNLFLNQAKKFLKSPSALFQKEKRLKINEQVALKTMAEHINFLIQPMKNDQDRFLKNPVFWCGVGCLFLSVGVPPLLSLASLFVSSFALSTAFAKKNYDESRHNWCLSYNKNAYKSARDIRGYIPGGKKKYRLILKAFQERYDSYLSAKEIDASKTDDKMAENLLSDKQIMQTLDPAVCKDLLLFSFLFSKYQSEESKRNINPDWWRHETLLKAKSICENNKGISLSWALVLVFQTRICKSNLLDDVIQKMTKEEILKIETPILKDIVLEKRKMFFPTEKGLGLKNKILVRSKSARKKFLLKRKQAERQR